MSHCTSTVSDCVTISITTISSSSTNTSNSNTIIISITTSNTTMYNININIVVEDYLWRLVSWKKCSINSTAGSNNDHILSFKLLVVMKAKG